MVRDFIMLVKMVHDLKFVNYYFIIVHFLFHQLALKWNFPFNIFIPWCGRLKPQNTKLWVRGTVICLPSTWLSLDMVHVCFQCRRGSLWRPFLDPEAFAGSSSSQPGGSSKSILHGTRTEVQTFEGHSLSGLCKYRGDF